MTGAWPSPSEPRPSCPQAQKMVCLAALLALSAAVGNNSPAHTPLAPIVLFTKTFSLSLDPATCLAQATYHPPQANAKLRVGAAVPFLSLYNRVADAREQNLDCCVAIASVQDDHSAGNASGPTLLRVTAA